MRKRWIKTMLWILASPIMLFLVAVFLVYLPPIQQRLISAVTQTVSDNSEFEVRIGHIALRFPLALSVNDTDVLTQQGDTLATIDELRIEIQPTPLLWKEIAVNGISVNGLRLDTRHLVPGLHLSGVIGELFLDSHGINITDETATVNRIMLSETDLSVCYTDTIASEEQPDTSALQLPWRIMLEHRHKRHPPCPTNTPRHTFPPIGHTASIPTKRHGRPAGNGVFAS